MRRFRHLTLFLLPLLATTAIGVEARAGGYLSARFGTDHGTPAMANPYAIYYNPAALGGTHGTTIAADGTFAYRYVKYTRIDTSPSSATAEAFPGSRDANTGDARLGNLLASPFLGFSTDLGGGPFRLGAGAYIPFGGSAKWDASPQIAGVPGSKDGPQRWQNISGQISAIYATVAAAYVIEQANLSIGLNGSFILHRIETLRARNADGSDDTVTGTGGLVEGRSYLKASGVGGGAALGVYWAPKAMNERLRLGLSYTKSTFGDTRMSGDLSTVLSASQPGPAEKVDFLQTYPDVIRLGVAHRFADSKLEVRADGQYERWSVFKNQCVVRPGKDCPIDDRGGSTAANDIVLNVKRDWNDAVSARAGGAYFVNPELEVFGSVGFGTPAVPVKTMDASTLDALRLSGTIGARYRFSEHLALAGSYNHAYFMTRNVDVASSVHPTLDGISKGPTAAGTYKSQIPFVNVNIAYTF